MLQFEKKKPYDTRERQLEWMNGHCRSPVKRTGGRNHPNIIKSQKS